MPPAPGYHHSCPPPTLYVLARPLRAGAAMPRLPLPCGTATTCRILPVTQILDAAARLCYTLFMDDSRWHIMRVKPGTEDDIASLCGWPAYVPRRVIKYFNRRLRKVVCYVKALIPGFVFIRLPAPSSLRMPPNSNVFGFLRNGDRTPAVLPRAAFDALRKVELEINTATAEKPSVQEVAVKVGDRIPVHLARFAEAVDALVEEVKGSRIIARMIRSQIRVEMDLRAI